MPDNKIFKEFLESTYDREKNYNSINFGQLGRSLSCYLYDYCDHELET